MNAPAQVPVVEKKLPSLLEQIEERQINPAQWHTLTQSLYPGARAASVLMVIDYCRARKLDPLKKPCHIVPVRVKDAVSGDYAWRDVVMPGIYELRTTAHRTGSYGGHSSPEYGPEIEHLGVKAPEWCAMTFYRYTASPQGRAEFPVRVQFREVVGVKDGGKNANERWQRAPVQMMTKCCEAAGLREAFPDELGGQIVEEETDRGAVLVGEVDTRRPAPANDELNAQLGLEERTDASA